MDFDDLGGLTDTSHFVLELHELLIGMLPRGWRSADLTVERGNGLVRVVNLGVQAAAPGTPPPFLGLDQNATIGLVNEVLAELSRALGELWTGTKLRFTREGATPELLLLDDAGAAQTQLAIDASLLLQLGAGLVSELPCGALGDANDDGEIDAIDASLILQFSAGLVLTLPV